MNGEKVPPPPPTGTGSVLRSNSESLVGLAVGVTAGESASPRGADRTAETGRRWDAETGRRAAGGPHHAEVDDVVLLPLQTGEVGGHPSRLVAASLRPEA